MIVSMRTRHSVQSSIFFSICIKHEHCPHIIGFLLLKKNRRCIAWQTDVAYMHTDVSYILGNQLLGDSFIGRIIICDTRQGWSCCGFVIATEEVALWIREYRIIIGIIYVWYTIVKWQVQVTRKNDRKVVLWIRGVSDHYSIYVKRRRLWGSTRVNYG